jgi:prolyl-tRNA editing enzyme YbaK/EbsC (Cys-tRNA(Pro) deacylase)
MSTSAHKVQKALEALGLECQVVEMAKTTRSAKDAAEAVGCRVEQIVKSLVFKGKHSQKAILVVASGVNRVNEKKLAEFVAEPVEMLDEDLLKYDKIWAAAGTPRAVFKLTPGDLQKITRGQVVNIK